MSIAMAIIALGGLAGIVYAICIGELVPSKNTDDYDDGGIR